MLEQQVQLQEVQMMEVSDEALERSIGGIQAAANTSPGIAYPICSL